MVNSQFSGSRLEADFIPLPISFFTQAMPKIQDIAELKVALYVLYLIQCKQGHPCFVTYEELKAVSCQLSAELDEETIRRALNSAINHGSLLHSTLKINGECEDVYLTNTESNKKLAKSIECGEFPLERTMSEKKEIKHNIFALYEQNIGIITPMIAEELKEAGKLYPAQWIDEAFKEAVVMNKRSWKYIARILERWASEGKESGAHRRSIKKGSPDKYIKGKYGHLVKR